MGLIWKLNQCFVGRSELVLTEHCTTKPLDKDSGSTHMLLLYYTLDKNRTTKHIKSIIKLKKQQSEQ